MSETSEKSLLEENLALKRRLKDLEALYQEQATKVEMLQAQKEATKAPSPPPARITKEAKARETLAMLVYAEQKKVHIPPGELPVEEAIEDWDARRRRTATAEELVRQDED